MARNPHYFSQLAPVEVLSLVHDKSVAKNNPKVVEGRYLRLQKLQEKN